MSSILLYAALPWVTRVPPRKDTLSPSPEVGLGDRADAIPVCDVRGLPDILRVCVTSAD